MSKARAKGTSWEVELLERLRLTFHHRDVERAPLKGINDWGDFTGTPILCEAKNTLRPNFLEWARTAEKKAGKAWSIWWHGDRRKPGSGPYVLCPIELFESLLSVADHIDDLRFIADNLKEKS